MSLLSLQLVQEAVQEQTQSLRQLQLVRCLVVHYKTDTGPVACRLPIIPTVSTRTAKKSGYEFCHCGDHEKLHNESVIAQAAAHALGLPVIPKELEGVVHLCKW